jgi:D-arabinose 1-dehydrogenase-like Zn-dependent alcohol dehydrogenase
MSKRAGVVAVMPKPGAPFEYREYPLPDPGPGEVLVAISQTNVCGSDLHMWRGELSSEFPQDVVLGHEMAGVVERIGHGAERDSRGAKLSEGDPVVWRYFEPCLSCPVCARGHYRMCAGSLFSVLRPASFPPHFVGGFSTHYLITGARTRFKLPDGLAAQDGAAAACALAQVVEGYEQAGLRPGESVVVQGAGGLGLFAVAMAKYAGAGAVVAIDLHQARLERAKELGADHVVDASAVADKRERTAAVRQLLGGEGADVVVDVVGRAEVIEEGIRMLARGGRYLEMGSIVPRDYAKLDASILVGENLSIVGVSLYSDASLYKAAQALALHQPLRRVVDVTMPLSKLEEAFVAAEALAGKPRGTRIGVRP